MYLYYLENVCKKVIQSFERYTWIGLKAVKTNVDRKTFEQLLFEKNNIGDQKLS